MFVLNEEKESKLHYREWSKHV